MAFEFKLPDIGEGVVEGEIVKWHIAVGDPVKEDQPMVEVMTDKATVVIPSPRAGRILETRGKEGEIAKVGGVLVVIEESATTARPEAASAAPLPAPAVTTSPKLASSPWTDRPAEPPSDARTQVAIRKTVVPWDAEARNVDSEKRESRRNGNRPVIAAPATRRLARELGVDLHALSGTGPSGRITSADVRTSVGGLADRLPEQPKAPVTTRSAPALALASTQAPGIIEERIPVRALRKRIWENMARSKSHATHFTFVEECDASALVSLRDRYNARLSPHAPKLSYLPFIVKAVIAAMKEYPDLNGHVDEAKMEFVRRRDYQIGIAAATERGLMVPVIRHADRRSIVELGAEVRRLGDLARDGKIGMEDLGGSTFTITSLGKEGGIFATPIINHPEVAIMGVHKLSPRAVVDDDGAIVARPMMNLSLSFDHRLIDGHVGAAFTYSVVRWLEFPERLLMEHA